MIIYDGTTILLNSNLVVAYSGLPYPSMHSTKSIEILDSNKTILFRGQMTFCLFSSLQITDLEA